MMYICLFAALAPTENFPNSGFKLTLQGDRFDLPLPTAVGDNLYRVIKTTGTGMKITQSRSCSPHTWTARKYPVNVGEKSNGDLLYREFSSRSEKCVGPDGQPKGQLYNRITVSASGACRLIEDSRQGKYFDTFTREHLARREAYFLECGGFDLLRTIYYFDAVEEERANSTLLSEEKEHTSDNYRPIRFTEWISLTE
jgi:hypothetical protein